MPATGSGHRSRWTATTVIAGALIGACSTPAPPVPIAAGDEAAVRRQVEALVRDEMRAHRVTGLSIALVDDQRVVFAFGAGWADEAAGRPADAHTVYRMGSVSKLFTAAAALQLAHEGRLALDAPVDAALPGWRPAAPVGVAPTAITPRQLMTHHAGLLRDLGRGMWGSVPEPLAARVAAVAGVPAAYPPGQVLEYSNVGYTVLGAAVEAVEGQPFDAVMQARLLAPLGLHDASFSAVVPVQPAMSRAYRDGREVEEPALADVPAGGLNASVLDMAQFIRAVFADAPGGGLQQMLQPQNDGVPLDVGFRIGLGWMLASLGSELPAHAGPVAHHGGATVHFRSQLMLLPAHRLGVIVAANSDGGGEVVNRVAERALALALQARTGAAPLCDACVEASRSEPVVPASADLDALAGDYTTALGLVRVRRSGRQLEAEAAGRTFQLVAQAEGEWSLRYRWLGLVPVSLGRFDALRLRLQRVAGRDLLVARIGAQTVRAGERLPPPAALPAAWAGLAGRYEPALAPGEHGTVDHVRVLARHGRLVARLKMRDEDEAPLEWVLLPYGDDEAIVLGTLADGGERIRRIEGDTAFRAAGYRWRRAP